MGKDNELSIYQGNLPAQASRRTEVEYTRQAERIAAIGALGVVGMSAMSEVERHASYKVASTAAAVNLYTSDRDVSPAEAEAQGRLFGEYINGMAHLAETTNNNIIHAVDGATEQLSKRSFADAFEDFDARLGDTLFGRPDYPNRPGLPRGRR